MTDAEMIEKINARTLKQICKITSRYRHFFHDGIVLNWMPLEDLARLEEIVEECIATGKPYDNYIPVPDDPDLMYDP